jgi:2-oxoisovalerate dehydrogenase E1 component
MVKSIILDSSIKPNILKFPDIKVFQNSFSLQEEASKGIVTKKDCIELIEQMFMIRTFEEMISEIVAGNYIPLPKYKYIGPTHLSIGQEAVSAGSIFALDKNDFITSTHRGHGDAISKGYIFIKKSSDIELKTFLKERQNFLKSISEVFSENDFREILEEKALKVHIYRMICELFGKSDGYCGGIGGSMHIADFEIGHLGANAIVGGHMGIATGAGIACRYMDNGRIVLNLVGDGAMSNGIAHEAICLATMAQFKNGLMDKKFGVPIIFGIVNNQYAMSGQEFGEITNLDYLARRAAAYDIDCMNAEVVDGMDVLAVYKAVSKSRFLLLEGRGPALLEFITYRFKGHSLSDPLTYRDKKESDEWLKRDPIKVFSNKIIKIKFDEKNSNMITELDLEKLKKIAWQRNAQMAIKASVSKNPDSNVIFNNVLCKNKTIVSQNSIKTAFKKYERNTQGEISYRLACREALIEEMHNNDNVIILGEDVADYGGAFGVTNDLIKLFGRDRVFNTPISESGIVGSAIGMSMTGLIPVAEIMYCDFILEAMDQIGNQAAKWFFMSGGKVNVPLVIRTAIGGGKGYAGQHSQSLESVVAQFPGLIVVAPSNPYDAKGLLKSAIRNSNPVIFFEHQLLYNSLGPVPEDEYLVPIGKAKVVKEGKDVTVISWSNMTNEAKKAAAILKEDEIFIEIIDLRTLIPLDLNTIYKSVKKTNKVLVFSQPVEQGSFASYIAYEIQRNVFDYLDSPVICLGSRNSTSPSAESLEKEFLPNHEKLIDVIKNEILGCS